MEHPENSGEYKGLVVNAGIEQPSSVNPYLKRKPKKRQLSVAEYVEGIIKGDVTILSRAVTVVESVKPEHQAIAPILPQLPLRALLFSFFLLICHIKNIFFGYLNITVGNSS